MTVYVVLAFTGNSSEVDGAYVSGVFANEGKAVEEARSITSPQGDPYVVEVEVVAQKVVA